MKILLIHNYYQQYGGEDSVFKAEHNLLENHGQQVITYTRNNMEINNYGILDKVRFIKNTLWSRKTEKDIYEICSLERPNVAHIHNIFPLISPSVYQALHKANIPIVQTLHNYRFLCANGIFYRNGSVCELCKKGNVLNGVVHKCYKNSYLTSSLYSTVITLVRLLRKFNLVNKFIALTPFIGNKYVEGNMIPKSKISILGNFIEIRSPISLLSQNENSKYALYFGRITKEKGIQTLLNAFEHLRHINLKIAGTGPYLDEIIRYVQIKKLNNIEFVGFQEKKQLVELIKKSFVVIIPSEWYENFPITALESMAIGIPIIASRIGGLPDVVEEGKSGFLFQPKDFRGLMDKIEILFSNPTIQEKMGVYAKQIASTRYGPDMHYKELIDLYNSIA